MIGRARSHGAITIANALPTGVGCAAGVNLPVEAGVTITSNRKGTRATHQIPADARSRLVRQALRTGLDTYLPRSNVEVTLELHSDVPVARGLKSSSAVSSAILLALAVASGQRPSSLEIGRLSAEVAQRAGVSATGALDDALAGLGPGFVVTDNTRGELLRRADVNPSWKVVLYIPPGRHPPSPRVRLAFARERRLGEQVARAAMDGDWARAMQLNTELVERTMGYSYENLRHRLRDHGAIASGVSGLGPTLATIAPGGSVSELLAELPSDPAQTRVVSFLQPGSETGGLP
ncbi:MAG TPA: shikimate kinase [Thermoplasmata archaeon]|nr:shikimate kinase [Thermoplasmata archaeon]